MADAAGQSQSSSIFCSIAGRNRRMKHTFTNPAV
jgi:hypothetical protein